MNRSPYLCQPRRTGPNSRFGQWYDSQHPPLPKGTERPEQFGALMGKLPDIKSRGLQGFYRDVVREMRHVNWPTRHEAVRLSGTVIGVCAILALLLTGLSIGIEQGLHLIGIGGK